MTNSKLSGIIKKAGIVLIIALIAIQFVRPEKNISTATASTDDMNVLYPIPEDVHQILDRACFDCHSNNTRYPWYNNIQPVTWWLNDHIEEGKRELNFSEFGKRTPAKQVKKLKKLAKEVQEGEMPLNSYTWIHKEARLTDSEKSLIVNWANDLSNKIAATISEQK